MKSVDGVIVKPVSEGSHLGSSVLKFLGLGIYGARWCLLEICILQRFDALK